eukprot:1666758-Alexandrium_andersonii.AAC.1
MVHDAAGAPHEGVHNWIRTPDEGAARAPIIAEQQKADAPHQEALRTSRKARHGEASPAFEGAEPRA